MLLPGTYSSLMKPCLSKTERSQTKIWLHLSEKMARNKEQAIYLKNLRNDNLFPASIENLQLPSIFDDTNMKGPKTFIKTYILKKMIRHLYGSSEKIKKKLSTIVNEIFESHDLSKAVAICSAIEEAYQKSEESHRKRLQKKYETMRNKVSSRRNSPPPPLPPSQSLVTDMTKSLTEQELDLLSKGPKFALTSDINEMDIKANYCLLANQLLWQQYQTDKKSENANMAPPNGQTIPKYPLSDRIYEPPSTNYTLEAKLKQCYAMIQALISRAKTQKPMKNLTNEEEHALKVLKSKPFTFLPSDKGSEFCVIETSKYDEAALLHLNDRTIYEPVKNMTAKTIETKINQTWRRISNEARVPSHITKSFVSTNTDLPTFYHLIKTHKTGPDLHIRPIITNRKGPSHKLSWLLSRILKPLLNSLPANLSNSLELLNSIKDIPEDDKKQFTYPFSLDVKSLYTSVPQTEAIEIAKEKFENTLKHSLPFTAKHIAEMLSIIVQHTFFRFKEQIFKQNLDSPWAIASQLYSLCSIWTTLKTNPSHATNK